MKLPYSIFVPALILIFIFDARGQGEPVKWECSSFADRNEVMLRLTVYLAPGWKVYSQFLEEGGPMPTRVRFHEPLHFELIGRTEEKGRAVTYHDSIYDMEVTWYSGSVSFLQRLQVLHPGATVAGVVEYLVCNDETCIPKRHEFSLVPIP
jgi:hypothetical protein